MNIFMHEGFGVRLGKYGAGCLLLLGIAMAGCENAGEPEALADGSLAVSASPPQDTLPQARARNVEVGTADQVILGSSLENEWANWSWAPNKLVPGGIQVHLNRHWQGVFFAHELPQSSAEFSALRFTIEAGPQDLANMEVRARVNNRPLAEFYLPTVHAHETKTFKISLAQLGLNGEDFDGFTIQADDLVSFTVKDVSLLGRRP